MSRMLLFLTVLLVFGCGVALVPHLSPSRAMLIQELVAITDDLQAEVAENTRQIEDLQGTFRAEASVAGVSIVQQMSLYISLIIVIVMLSAGAVWVVIHMVRDMRRRKAIVDKLCTEIAPRSSSNPRTTDAASQVSRSAS